MQRAEKLKLLDGIFNQSNRDSLKSLSRKFCPSVLIYEQQPEGMLFSGRLNSTLPVKYLDQVLSDAEVNTMLVAGGNTTTFLLPDNGRR